SLLLRRLEERFPSHRLFIDILQTSADSRLHQRSRAASSWMGASWAFPDSAPDELGVLMAAGYSVDSVHLRVHSHGTSSPRLSPGYSVVVLSKTAGNVGLNRERTREIS
ncbi:MAG: hypothetical protein Q8P67_01970, partial [archaeon]|nr:hypothetical protein [archaeon]